MELIWFFMDQFCPNCKCYHGDQMRPVCHKCGHVIDPEAAKGGIPAVVSLACTDKDNGQAKYKCPTCGSGLSLIQGNALSFELLGKEIPVGNVSALRMSLVSRATTQVIVEFDGGHCEQGHKFFRYSRDSVREICPVCKGSLVRFGASVFSCRHCHLSITKDNFVYIEGKKLLEDEGWTYWPDPFACQDNVNAKNTEVNAATPAK
jgi:hypothetical protein